MARSLHGILRRLSGTPRTAAELTELGLAARAQAHSDLLLPGDLVADAVVASAALPSTRVAVVGGGFAGLTAAWWLAQCGAAVTVFEASDRIGGRVRTDHSFVAGKHVEAGAELIGANHPLWWELSGHFGLSLAELTPEEDYENAGLAVQLRLGDHTLTRDEREQVHKELLPVLDAIGADAFPIDPVRPWTSADAALWDGTSVADRLDQLMGPASSLARAFFDFGIANDNCAPTWRQSYLGLLALVSAGRTGNDVDGMRGYWDATETHRCAGGNEQLAHHLAASLDDVRLNSQVDLISITEDTVGVDWSGFAGGSEAFSYAVLAAPPTSWPAVESTPAWDPAARTMSHGPAVKHLTATDTAFWADHLSAPVALWDRIGSVWEGTDRQGDFPPHGLSVYSGGPHVLSEHEYQARLCDLYPTYAPTATRFVDWPATPWIGTGYSVPAPGEVTTIGANLATPHAGRLLMAGEQACVGFFGYMEGALQSGARAARAIVETVCPEAFTHPA